MPDTNDKDIDALLAALDWGPGALTNEEMLDRSHAALTALVAERNALKTRVMELESQQPADRDRDKALERWMDQVTAMLCHSMTHSHDAKQELVNRCDAAIAAMRKGESDGK